MIRVAIMASSPMTRARLDALVVAQPRLRVASTALAAPAVGEHVPGALVDADVLLMDPGEHPAEPVLRSLRAPRLPPVVLLGGEVTPAAWPRLVRAGVRGILPRDASSQEFTACIEAAVESIRVGRSRSCGSSWR